MAGGVGGGRRKRHGGVQARGTSMGSIRKDHEAQFSLGLWGSERGKGPKGRRKRSGSYMLYGKITQRADGICESRRYRSFIRAKIILLFICHSTHEGPFLGPQV